MRSILDFGLVIFDWENEVGAHVGPRLTARASPLISEEGNRTNGTGERGVEIGHPRLSGLPPSTGFGAASKDEKTGQKLGGLGAKGGLPVQRQVKTGGASRIIPHNPG